MTVTASPGIVVVRASGEEGDISDLIAGSAAKVAVLANKVSAVAKSILFMAFVFLRLTTILFEACAASNALDGRRFFGGGQPWTKQAAVNFVPQPRR